MITRDKNDLWKKSTSYGNGNYVKTQFTVIYHVDLLIQIL